MFKISTLVVAIIAAGLLFGWVKRDVSAQVQDPMPAPANTEVGEWEMFSDNVAGAGGADSGWSDFPPEPPIGVYGDTYLFNSKTGEIYRIFQDCGDDGPNGCIVRLPEYP